ncbi:MAG TPA: phage shock protein operon transcriptional activator [Candidatus Bathyarchaeia archaeon]|nr:phage shock protein operon transcriptional activator [Candidatus Bathyarchaeia archaeon]
MARKTTVPSSNDLPQRQEDALGQAEVFLEFQERLSRAARVDRPVLIVGERGSGKELAASRLHYLSARWEEPFVTLNCAALSPNLIESELFGHEAGAFTGAVSRRAGRFEAANGGTLFLDEIGAIPVEVQEKILRVVEYGTFERVGNTQPIRVDVRIVGATNADLVGLCAEGKFKRDLLDRLSFEVLPLPSLRERKEDILLLANHFAARMAFELGRAEVPEFSDEAAAALEQYPWPGNIRELKNVVERAVYRADGPVIAEVDFDPFRRKGARDEQAEMPESTVGHPPTTAHKSAALGRAAGDVPTVDRSFEALVRDYQAGLVRDALMRARYNQRKAAELLGLSYDQFRGYYRKFRGLL